MTPLNRWNPYMLTDRGSDTSREGAKVTANGRDGSMTPDLAYDGVNDGLYYKTPAEFYATKQPHEKFIADTGMVIITRIT